MSTALDFRKVDLKNLVVPPLEKKDHGLSVKPLYSHEGGPPAELAIQTPICKFPFGLSNNADQPTYVPGTPVRYNVSAAFKDHKTDDVMKDFFAFCSQIQEYGVHLAAHNSKAWFGEEADAKSCRMLFNKWIKMPKGDNADKYDPTFRMSVRAKRNKDGTVQEGEFWTTLYDVPTTPDTDGEVIDLSKLEKGSFGHMKIKLTSFYVIANKFGFTWDVEWIRLTQHAQARVDDYNPNMYGEAPSIPALPDAAIYQSIQPLGATPVVQETPAVTTSDEPNDVGKREAEADEESTTAKPGATKRIKRSS